MLVKSRLPSKWGEYRISAFGVEGDMQPHVVLERGVSEALEQGEPIPVRIHSECMTGDVFASRRCDCGEQLQYSLEHFKENGGLLIYLRQEGRGIGLVEKLRAYNLQDEGLNTFEVNVARGHGEDERDYAAALEILGHFSVARIRLMTNNPLKEEALVAGGIEVVERIPVTMSRNAENAAYLKAKEEITGHFL